jgi:hypothetical protein
VVPTKTLLAQTGHMGLSLHAVFCLTLHLPFLVPVRGWNSAQYNSEPVSQVSDGGGFLDE